MKVSTLVMSLFIMAGVSGSLERPEERATCRYPGGWQEMGFRCSGGNVGCIKAAYRCDGDLDCQTLGDADDRSDEEGCGKKCSGKNWQGVPLHVCANGECTKKSDVCDSNEYADCKDGSDEVGCPAVFHCSGGNLGRIKPAYKCDGKLDCKWLGYAEDHSDEEGCGTKCSGKNRNGAQFHACANGECTLKSYVCDNTADCKDGSDEVGCFDCSGGNFGRIKAAYRCDGELDCESLGDADDHSDEEVCGTKCSGNNWDGAPLHACANGECTKKLYVCDNDADCKDGSDEDCPQD